MPIDDCAESDNLVDDVNKCDVPQNKERNPSDGKPASLMSGSLLNSHYQPISHPAPLIRMAFPVHLNKYFKTVPQ